MARRTPRPPPPASTSGAHYRTPYDRTPVPPARASCLDTTVRLREGARATTCVRVSTPARQFGWRGLLGGRTLVHAPRLSARHGEQTGRPCSGCRRRRGTLATLWLALWASVAGPTTPPSPRPVSSAPPVPSTCRAAPRCSRYAPCWWPSWPLQASAALSRRAPSSTLCTSPKRAGRRLAWG